MCIRDSGKIAYGTISPEEAQLAEDRVAAVRDAVGPNVDILVEVHARFNVYTAVGLAHRLEQYRPFWFEEPVSPENISEMKQVRDRINIPVATGEKLYLKFPFFELIKNEAIDIFQPDICNAGGITEVKKISSMAEAHHLMMAPHNTNSAIGTVASIHLCAAMPNFLIQEYHAEFYEPHYFEVISGLPRQENGMVDLPTGPGLGIEVDDELLERLLGEVDIAYTDLETVVVRILGTPPGNFTTHIVEIDKGSDDGLAEGQPVVTGAGLVGRLEQVDRARSIVRLATHPDFRVGVRLVDSQDEGLARGTGDEDVLVLDAGTVSYTHLTLPTILLV